MGIASANQPVERLDDLILGGTGVLIDERFAVEHRSADAERALRGLLFDEGSLNRVRIFGRTQALDRSDFMAPNGRHRPSTGANRHPIEEHRAGAALCRPASELRPIELTIFA